MKEETVAASNWPMVFGVDDSEIDYQSLACPLHRAMVAPFIDLQTAAAEAGIALTIASGYRDFSRQLHIWNRKAQGEVPVRDDAGCVLSIADVSEWQLAQAILRWSALPGASRHHWGTDVDVYDRAAVAADYRLLLIPDEYRAGGPFARLNDWLQDYLGQQVETRFFRPYDQDRGGVAPEPWHLSYAPLAAPLQAQCHSAALRNFLQDKPLALKATVLEHLDDIVRRFVQVPLPSTGIAAP